MVHINERRVTQKDIAQAAGLSIAAVSMALKGNQALPESTINRVRKIAEELGYVPDPALSALAAHRSFTRQRTSFSVLALVTHGDHSCDWEKRESSKSLIHWTSERAKQLGYRLEHFSTYSENLSPSRLSQILCARGIRGLILSPASQLPEDCGIDWEKFSIVSIEQEKPELGIHCVASDQYGDMKTCWEKLRAKGIQKIGLALDSTCPSEGNEQWQAAHLYSLSHHGIEAKDIVPTLNIGADDEPEKLAQWISENKPEAIISNKAGLPEQLKELGVSIPQDMAFVSLNAEDESDSISGIQRSSEIIGSVAVDTLNSLIQQNRFGTRQAAISTKVRSKWHDGESI
ncbi:LacI family DNA-binding transcriptional regulator [Pelagicoccus mobilis]|uniref:LacI family DNA-binding transcriptional regulator n=1 Tax=Pelagicoccus mobilis TaxID=415221 RepID=A0A934VJ77_9BACT|nr:LacI family DNA-binding transcriptional regulator [Pelagicoccus mobilis]MBK1875316.1 LacI family DNA-binding transcriptional regulator [Pelagicoccus mobilis]